MKFITNYKFYIAFIFIYLVISTEIYALNACRKDSKKSYSKLKSKNFAFQNAPYTNPLGNFAAGVAEDLFFGDRNYLGCFPPEWFSKDKTSLPEEHKNEVETNVEPVLSGLEIVERIGLNVLDFACHQRKLLLHFIHYFFLARRFRKYRLMMDVLESEEKLLILLDYKEKNGQSESGSRKLDKLKKNSKNKNSDRNVKEMGISIKERLIELKNEIESFVHGKIFLNIFQELKGAVKKFIDTLKNFFKGFLTKKLLDCTTAIKNSTENTMKVVKGILSKAASLEIAIQLNGPGIIAWVIDFVVALICDHQKISDAIGFFKTAVSAKESSDTNKRFYFFGKGLGKILNVFSTTDTFADSILHITNPALK